MPRLGAFRDNDELDNAIIDKTVVYVEGPDDVTFFNNLTANQLRDRLEFKTPEEGTGYHEVRKRVAALRPDNKKVYGLLDGEAAVALGELRSFIAGGPTLFTANDAALEGLVFLSEYELENLYVCHTKLARFIANDVSGSEIGSRKEVDVQRVINTLTLRYVLFTVIKFAMIGFHSEERPCKGIGKIGGRFLDKEVGAAHLMRNDVHTEISPQVDWSEFLREMHSLLKEIRDQQEARAMDDACKRRDALRISDGKFLLKHLRNHYSGSSKWEGHLHDQLAESEYSSSFGTALLAATRTAQRAAPPLAKPVSLHALQ